MPRQVLIVLPSDRSGATGSIDDAGGAKPFTVTTAEFPEATARVDLEIGSNCTDAFTFVKIQAEGCQPYRQDGILLRAGLDRQIRVGVAPDPGRHGDTVLPALQPLITPSRYALKGRLQTKNGRFYDATGPCGVFFASDFPALNIRSTDRAEANRSNKVLADAGWQGKRLFIRLADDYGIPPVPSKFWYGRHVSHGMAKAHLREELDDLAQYQMKAILTKGAKWGKFDGDPSADAQERDELAEICSLVAAWGHSETVAIVELLGNEANINHRYGRDIPRAVAYAQTLVPVVKNTLGCLVSMGAFDEGGDTLRAISAGMDLTDIHHDRSMPDGIKHIHTAWDFCIYKHEVGKGIWQGENVGLNDPYPFGSQCGNLSTPTHEPDYVFAAAAVQQLTNQATCYLNGPMIRHFCAIDSCWGVNELPDLLANVPKDIGTYEGRSFFTKNGTFVWAGLTEWGQMQRPPFEVGHWRAVSALEPVKVGVGIAELVEAMTAKAYIVKGTYV